MIKLHPQDEEDLRWWACGEIEAICGRRSSMHSLMEAGRRGVMFTPGPRREELTERARAAFAREREIRSRLAACSVEQEALLRVTFGAGQVAGLEAYGQFPLAALRSPIALEACRLLQPPPTVRRFLEVLAAEATQGPRKERRRAMVLVKRIREESERSLVEALIAYGAGLELTVIPAVGLRQLARALGVSHHTAAKQLERRGVARSERRPGRSAPWVISMEELRTCWPEAARAVLEFQESGM